MSTFVQRVLMRASLAVATALVASMSFAQIPSVTTIVSEQNPSTVGQTVQFTARVVSGQLRYSGDIGVGAAGGSRYYFRFEITGGGKFKTAPAGADLVNLTTPANFASKTVVLGGAAGQAWVVYEVATGATATAINHQLRFAMVPDGLSDANSLVHSVHETLASAAGDMPSNTSQLYRTAPQLFSSLSAPFTVGGTVTFQNGGVTVPGCASLALAAPVQTCLIAFNSSGNFAVTAIYSGDANYATSTGSLAQPQQVIIDFTPTTLTDATVGVPYSLALAGAGGTAPYTFAVESGSLPAGLSMTSAGVISGTPLRSAGFEFVIRVTDANGATYARTTTLAVNRGTQTITFNPPSTATVGTTLTVPITSSVGLVVFYQIDSPSVCAVTGATLRFLTPGACLIVPIQSGDSSYLPAASIPRNISVTVAGGVQPLRIRSANAESTVVSMPTTQLILTTASDPGSGQRIVAQVDIDGNKTPDLVFLNTTQGELGEVRVWQDGNNGADRVLRNVRLLWRVDAVGDLDGDGFGDLVWRFTGQTPNIDDTGVSYVWFTNGNNVSQVRKRGGAPLSWQLLGAMDMNGDGAADMVYISPTNEIRVLMATANRTCANLAAGSIPAGFTALKLASFTAFGRAEILARNATTGETTLVRLDATGVTLPAPTANPDDPNASCTSTSATVRNTVSAWSPTATNLSFFGTADFNGDGMADIVWVRADRTTVVWLSQGAGQSYSAIENPGSIPAGFSAIQP
jgi:hypothetical protein